MLPYQYHQKLASNKATTTKILSANHSSPEKFRDVPFYIWNKEQHKEGYHRTKGHCCFNHIVGLPIKDGVQYPLFDYEKILYDSLLLSTEQGSFKDKHLWVKKSTGLGITEFCLRLMAWLCTSTDSYKNSQMVIVTGPNIELATKLIRRLKAIFSSELEIYFTNKETVLELNGVNIEAYPSNHIDAFRSLTNPKLILCDETISLEITNRTK